jgi:hypothetical protein
VHSAGQVEGLPRFLLDQSWSLGWIVQSRDETNLGAGCGIAVREFPRDT